MVGRRSAAAHVLSGRRLLACGPLALAALVNAVLREHPSRVHARDAEGSTPLHVAARQDQGAIAGLLLDHGADPRARDARGRTPLSLCITCDFCRGGAVAPLVARGSDDALTPSERATLLPRAARAGDDVVVRAVVERSIDLRTTNGNGGTLLTPAPPEVLRISPGGSWRVGSA